MLATHKYHIYNSILFSEYCIYVLQMAVQGKQLKNVPM